MTSVGAFGAAVLPPELGEHRAADLEASVERYLGRLPRSRALTVRAGMAGTALAVAAMTGRRLSRLPPDRREEALGRLAAAGALPETALHVLKSVVLLAHGADAFAAELLDGGARSDPARPDGTISCTPSTEWPSRVRADAVVVGSGAGGAMAARELARAGARVVVLEEGRRFSVQEFRTGHPLDRVARLYRDGGATFTVGRPPLLLPLGRGVGGTTLVNSGTCYRPPERVRRRWHERHGLALADPARLGPLLDEVEDLLRVAPVPDRVMGRNGELVLQGARRLGWRAGPVRRNAPGCGGCCQCSIGCPRNAKYGVHLNALPQASAAGARMVTEATALRVLHAGGRARGVEARRPDGTTFVIAAPTVVVAAGATETPPLLRRSGLGRHPEVGRNLSVHPAAGVTGRFEEPVVAWHGVLQSAAVEEFHDRHGVLIEATATPPGMGSMLFPGYGRTLMRWLEDADRMATVGALIADRPSGSVVGSRPGATLIRYRLHRSDARRLVGALGMMARLLFAAGAREVHLGSFARSLISSPAEIPEALAEVDHRRLHVSAFHPTGTARAGSDPDLHPVDPEGRLRGVDGVWVADASIVPRCPEVNPQVSIMALSLGVARAAVAEGA